MRNLQADLQICNKATLGPWYIEKTYGIPEIRTKERRIAKPLYHMGSEDREVEANANFIAAAREGWPEAIERAIKAEMELHDVWTITDIYKISAAVLREENELQRQAIQDLSQQLVKLQAERDAAVEDIKCISVCDNCKRVCQGEDECLDNGYMYFEWRGLEVTP